MRLLHVLPGTCTVVFYIAISMIAMGLKVHYSTAGSDDLSWMLAPTAQLVQLVSGSEFGHEPGAGYVRTDGEFVIAPACAGVNFMITAFCMSAFYGVWRQKDILARSRYVFSCLLLSYVLTLLVNTIRIEISIALYAGQVQWGWLNPNRIHRITGIVVYFASLSLLYSWLRHGAERKKKQRVSKRSRFLSLYRFSGASSVVPFAWYSAIAIGIPLLNRGWQKGDPLFIEHCLTVFSASLVVFLSFHLIKLMYLHYQIIRCRGHEDKK